MASSADPSAPDQTDGHGARPFSSTLLPFPSIAPRTTPSAFQSSSLPSTSFAHDPSPFVAVTAVPEPSFDEPLFAPFANPAPVAQETSVATTPSVVSSSPSSYLFLAPPATLGGGSQGRAPTTSAQPPSIFRRHSLTQMDSLYFRPSLPSLAPLSSSSSSAHLSQYALPTLTVAEDLPPAYTGSYDRKRIQLACLPCRQAKRRCSGGTPCLHCQRRGIGTKEDPFAPGPGGKRCAYDATESRKEKDRQKELHRLALASERSEHRFAVGQGTRSSLEAGKTRKRARPASPDSAVPSSGPKLIQPPVVPSIPAVAGLLPTLARPNSLSASEAVPFSSPAMTTAANVVPVVVPRTPGAEYRQKTWWDALLAMFGPDRKIAAQEISFRLSLYFRTVNHLFASFVIRTGVMRNIYENRLGVEPSLVLAMLAWTSFHLPPDRWVEEPEGDHHVLSHTALGQTQNAGGGPRLIPVYETATRLASEAHACFEASIMAMRGGLTIVGWLLAALETIPQPTMSEARTMSVFAMLDSLIRYEGKVSGASRRFQEWLATHLKQCREHKQRCDQYVQKDGSALEQTGAPKKLWVWDWSIDTLYTEKGSYRTTRFTYAIQVLILLCIRIIKSSVLTCQTKSELIIGFHKEVDRVEAILGKDPVWWMDYSGARITLAGIRNMLPRSAAPPSPDPSNPLEESYVPHVVRGFLASSDIFPTGADDGRQGKEQVVDPTKEEPEPLRMRDIDKMRMRPRAGLAMAYARQAESLIAVDTVPSLRLAELTLEQVAEIDKMWYSGEFRRRKMDLDNRLFIAMVAKGLV